MSINHLNIQNKQTGDKLSATEFNSTTSKINEVVDGVNASATGGKIGSNGEPLTKDSNGRIIIPLATSSSSGAMSASDKSKLDSINPSGGTGDYVDSISNEANYTASDMYDTTSEFYGTNHKINTRSISYTTSDGSTHTFTHLDTVYKVATPSTTAGGATISGKAGLMSAQDKQKLDMMPRPSDITSALSGKADKQIVVLVTRTQQGSTYVYSASKTFTEISTAIGNGTNVILQYDGNYYHLSYSTRDYIVFTRFIDDAYMYSSIEVNSHDEWSYSSFILQEELTIDSTPTSGSSNPISSGGVYNALRSNFKTVNGVQLLGSGNIQTQFFINFEQVNGEWSCDWEFSDMKNTYIAGATLRGLIELGGNSYFSDVSEARNNFMRFTWIIPSESGTAPYSIYNQILLVLEAQEISTGDDMVTTVIYQRFNKPILTPTDLRAVAFSGSYSDLSDTPTFKTVAGNSILGTGNVALTGSIITYGGEEETFDGYTIDESLDILDTNKQDTLVSGTNIKTVNNITLLGSGNIDAKELVYGKIQGASFYSAMRNPRSGNWTFSDNAETPNEQKIYIDILTNIIYKYDADVGYVQIGGGQIKTINGQSLIGSGNVTLDTELINYDGDGNTYFAAGDSLTEGLDSMADAIDNINPNEISSVTATESSTSGGNNVVTITQTNGTTTSFNVKNGIDGVDGQDGADGVSLGEVALVQTTGDSEESVMSQKAVTEYGRKVTAEDLNGTSDWIKAKLTEQGWEFGKYVGNSGNLGTNANYCATFFIPMDMSTRKGHSITFGYMFNAWNIANVAWYNENKAYVTGLYYHCSENNVRTVIINTSGTWDNAAYIRMTCNPNKLNECYILDNTTGEYIFKGDEYLVPYYNNNNITYGFLENNVIAHELGNSATKVGSQKMITKAINYNVNIEHGEGLDTGADYVYIKMTPKAVSLLNASEKMTLMFSTRGTGSYNDYRYFGFGSSGTTKNSFDDNGAWIYWSYNANLGVKMKDYNLNLYNSKRPTPDVWIVTWDRVTGTVSLYDRTTLLNTLTSDNYKCDHFVNSNGVLILKTGNNKARIYDIRIFDYDISYLFDSSRISQEIRFLDGAGTPSFEFLDNYTSANADNSFKSVNNLYQGGGYQTCVNTMEEDGLHIVVKDTTTTTQMCGGKPYYNGIDGKAQIEKLEFEVVSGVIKTSYDGYAASIFYHITDENGEEIVDYNNIGVGKYTLTRTTYERGARLDFYKVSGDVEVVMSKTTYYKPISCVFHMKCNTLYNNELYDDQTGEFMKIYDDVGCTTESTSHLLIDTPQRVIRREISTSSGLPHYAGEMAVVGSNVYIGMPDYTWKQINNS